MELSLLSFTQSNTHLLYGDLRSGVDVMQLYSQGPPSRFGKKHPRSPRATHSPDMRSDI